MACVRIRLDGGKVCRWLSKGGFFAICGLGGTSIGTGLRRKRVIG
jgi:hypothetical protein